tara:strand:- start:344 stop:823 length:480 start_codon:yes stop_codon:yes gene_type:complete
LYIIVSVALLICSLVGLIITGVKLPNLLASNVFENGFQMLDSALSFIKEKGLLGNVANPPNDVNAGDEKVKALPLTLPFPLLVLRCCTLKKLSLLFPDIDVVESFVGNVVVAVEVFACCVVGRVLPPERLLDLDLVFLDEFTLNGTDRVLLLMWLGALL